MKRNIILGGLVVLALGVLLGFLIDRYLIDQTFRENVPTEVISEQVITDEIVELNTPAPTPESELGPEVSVLDFCADIKARIPGSEGFVITTTVAAGGLIVPGTILSGCIYSVNGSYAGWAPFEGQVGSYSLIASDGTTLGEGPLSIMDENWLLAALAGESIEYRSPLMFDAAGYTSGELILRNENASGESALEETIVIPVRF